MCTKPVRVGGGHLTALYYVTMKTLFVRTATLLALSAAAACGSDEPGSAQLRGLKEGMTTSEAVSSMGQGPLTATYSDTVRLNHGFRSMRYFINGNTFEVVYARELPGVVTEPVLQAKETPVVFRNDTLMGWGWRYFVDEAMPKFQLPTPLRAIDTLSTPLQSDSALKLDSIVKAKGVEPPTSAVDTTKKN